MPAAARFAAVCTILWSVALLAQEQLSCLHKTVAVSVVQRDSGEPVPGLGPTNFQARARGKQLRIASARVDPGPKRVLVILDSSGSMVGDKWRWQTARKAGMVPLQSDSPSNSVAVIVFASKVDLKVGFQSGRDAALGALQSLPEDPKHLPKGPRATALLDAVTEGLKLFGEPQFGDTILLITDGADNASRASDKKVLREAIARSVRILVLFFSDNLPKNYSSETTTYLVGLGADGAMTVDRNTSRRYTMLGERGWDQAAELAGRSGGQVLLVDSNRAQNNPSQAVADIASRLNRLISEVYRLELELPEPIPKPKGWDLKVAVPKGSKAKDPELLFPRSITACPKE